MIRTPAHATATDLQQELAVLEERLRDGERRIEEAIVLGASTEKWEEFWIELLHTYEAVYSRLQGVDPEREPIAA